MSEFSVVQLPPNSTGSKVVQTSTLEVHYRNKQNGGLLVGDIAITATGLQGTVVKIKEATASTGEIYIRLDKDFDESTLVDGEDITVDGQTRSTVSVSDGVEPFLTQNVVLAGHNNPLNRAYVDDHGALITSFTSGDPSFDAFGRLKTSESRIIREYQPLYDTLPNDFYELTVGSGNIAFDSVAHTVVLSTGTANGDHAMRRSHLYHRYQTGIGTTIIFSAYLGDSGKENVERKIGLYDDNDGVYFHANGTGSTSVGVVVRSSVTGSVVERHFHQPLWNVDRLDGAGDIFNNSQITLDMTKSQVMFIDFQWLGAGRIRFGFVIDGIPIICHEIYNANEVAGPYMRTGSLPLTMEQFNNGAAASPSYMYNISAAVMCEGEYAPRQELSSGSLPPAVSVPAGSDTDYVFIGAVRPVERISFGDRLSKQVNNCTFAHSHPGSPPIPGVITSDSVDFEAAGFANGDYIQIDDTAAKNRGIIYIVESVSGNTMTMTTKSPPMYDDFLDCTIVAKDTTENRAVGEIKDITLMDVSGQNNPFLVELVKNAGLASSNTAALEANTSTITGNTSGYTDKEICDVTGGTGTGAIMQVDVSGGVVTSAHVVVGGDGYTLGDTLTLTGRESAANGVSIDINQIGTSDFSWQDAYSGNMLDAAKPSTGVVGTTYRGSAVYTGLMKDGYIRMDLREYFERNTELMHRKALITEDPDDWTIRVRAFDPTHTANIAFSISWLEIRN